MKGLVLARRKSPILTETELRLMDVLWEKGKATVSEVVAALSRPEKAPAYSTVLTMLRILTEKGYARHEKEGRAYVYHPVVLEAESVRVMLVPKTGVPNVVEADSPDLMVDVRVTIFP